MTGSMVRDAAWFVLWAAAATLLIIAVWALVARRENRRDDALDSDDRETVALFTAMNNKNVPRPGLSEVARDGSGLATMPDSGRPGHHERPRAAHAFTLRGRRPWRRDGMGAQGEPATGVAFAPGANTIPPRTCGAVSGAGSFTCDRPHGHDGMHADTNRSGTVTWDDSYSADRCSAETEVSCRDTACPVHGDDSDALDDLQRAFLGDLDNPAPMLGVLPGLSGDTEILAAPGTDLVLASPPLPWGDDDTLTTMLAVRARHKKVAMADAVRRTEAVLARAERVLAGATA